MDKTIGEIETARPHLERLISETAGVKVVSLHHDISTVTGEEFILFTLAEAPACREVDEKIAAPSAR